MYKKGSGSTARYLIVSEGDTVWHITYSTTSTGGWIASGRATNSPTSSRAGGSDRFGETRWRYWDGERGSEGNISVTCN